MPIQGFAASFSSIPPNATLPLVGLVKSAAMRRRVVFPAPFGPSSATNSPGTIPSDTPRNANIEPKRFSTRSRDISRPALAALRTAELAGARADSVPDKCLTFHQVAQNLLNALA